MWEEYGVSLTFSLRNSQTGKSMADPVQLEALSKAFSGLGVDERSLISILGRLPPDHRKFFRKGAPDLFQEDERSFERWIDARISLLKAESLRFNEAVVMWAMHPWERDARLMKEAVNEGPNSFGVNVIVEIACTRTSEQLLGARKAYHSLFDRSVEEDVVTHFHGRPERKLLVGLVSAYRYEGTKVNTVTVKSEAKLLFNAISSEANNNNKNPVEDEEVVRILTTRSKPHIHSIYEHYKEIAGKSIREDLEAAELILKQTVECLCTPHVYFSKVVDEAMKKEADEKTKKGLTRVIVTRADTDMKETEIAYNNLFGASLTERVEEATNGNYKEMLVTLLTTEHTS
ncbi:Annexin D4 [Linum grandiflorum]